MQASNPIEFQLIVNSALEIALKGTMKALLTKLQSTIESEVYSYQSNGSWSGRTGEFKESWDFSDPSYVNGWYNSVISNEDFNWTWNDERDKYSHGNWNNMLGSMPNYLNSIINTGLSNSNYNFPAIQARPYWDMFLLYCETNIDRIFREEWVKTGLGELSIATTMF